MAGLYESLMASMPDRQPSASLYEGLVQPNEANRQVFAQVPKRASSAYTINDGPEYNKWDEALQVHGRIRIPKSLDEPQVWLNAPHLRQILENVDREDLPDGSVILSRKMPMS